MVKFIRHELEYHPTDKIVMAIRVKYINVKQHTYKYKILIEG